MEKAKRNTARDEKIKTAERVEILILVDNYVDLLLPDIPPVVKRAVLSKGKEVSTETLLAEHGLSLLISIYTAEKRYKLLFDTGYTQTCIQNNLKMLDIGLADIDAIIISHFHMDHTGGLNWVIGKCKKGISLFAHPDAFLYPRYAVLPDGRKLLFPKTMDKKELIAKGVDIVETKSVTKICDGFALITGQIERKSSFEKGMPNLFIERDGKVEKDIILDDQALVISLRDKGIVVISGCAHSGIINTIRYAQKITGIDQVYAVIGGFHLSGPFFEPAVEPTLNELREIAPSILIPMHCTGWNTIKRMSEVFSSCVLSSVGSMISL